MPQDMRPLIMHIVYRFDIGGLENGVVNLINQLPVGKFRHLVVALTEVSDFRLRIRREDVEFVALNKAPGQGFWLYPRLYRLFKQRQPAIVHSRNLAALEAQLPAWAAGVPVRIHGEHGREGADLSGSRRYQWLRRGYGLFVHRFVALSGELARYLHLQVGIASAKIEQVCNGVDTQIFHPAKQRQMIADCPFGAPEHLLVGTVGRLQAVKNQVDLARAFVLALRQRPELALRLRLVLVGEGALLPELQEILRSAGLEALAWLPGERGDIAEVMRGLDMFVLPSLGEGIANTILEAMACGLAVVATDVGGNPELVQHGVNGLLVPAADPQALAEAIVKLADDADLRRAMGQAGRQMAEQRFSLETMVARYQRLYSSLLQTLAPTRLELNRT